MSSCGSCRYGTHTGDAQTKKFLKKEKEKEKEEEEEEEETRTLL